jgi:hypothetical protein
MESPNWGYRATAPTIVGCHLRERRRTGAARFTVIRQQQARGRIVGAVSEQRFAARGGNTPALARRPGGRTGAERGADGVGDELGGLGVDGDVAAEQHAADDLPGVPGCVLRAGGQCQRSFLR